MTGRLPDWLIIGAPKAGTTTLAEWLREHPDVFVSKNKEVGFFDSNLHRGLDWYADHFADARADQRIGEATPAYLYYDDALDRIAEVLPDVRLAVILREPVARAWSHTWYFRMLTLERRRPVAILDEELRHPGTPIAGLPFGYLDMSRYVDRLEAVTARFPREQLLVLLTDDLRADADGTYARLCEHIGVRPVAAPTTRANEGGTPRSMLAQRLVADVGRRLPRSRVRNKVVLGLMRANRRDGYPAMPADLRDRVAAALAPDNDRLADWLGRDLPPSWSTAR